MNPLYPIAVSHSTHDRLYFFEQIWMTRFWLNVKYTWISVANRNRYICTSCIIEITFEWWLIIYIHCLRLFFVCQISMWYVEHISYWIPRGWRKHNRPSTINISKEVWCISEWEFNKDRSHYISLQDPTFEIFWHVQGEIYLPYYREEYRLYSKLYSKL